MEPKVIFKTGAYILFGITVGVSMVANAADSDQSDAKPALRTEIKASLEPVDRPAQDVAQSVGKAIAAEILSSGLNTEILKHRLETTPKPSKVASLKPADEPAPGQADQT